MTRMLRPSVLLRFRRWLFLVLTLPATLPEALAGQPTLGPFEDPQPGTLRAPVGDEPFDVSEALHGASSSLAQCQTIENAYWVEVEGQGDCIRTYAHGLQAGANPVVMIYLAGDVMLRTAYGIRYIGASYTASSPAKLTEAMKAWSELAGVPAIQIARPGYQGSSGDHNQRRHPREIALVDAAMDAIRQRYGVERFVLAGQSGGAHVAASLLNRRNDIEAAVLASGVLSARRLAALWENRRKVRGSLLYDAQAFYDPIDELDRISKSPEPRIFVLSDPEDRSVSFSTQLHYVRLLRNAGYKPQHVYLHAPDRQRHGLAEFARLAAALLAQGEGDREVRAALSEIELRQFAEPD